MNWTSPRGDDTELGRYVICKSPSAICVTARGLARPWGAMELQMETVCECADAAPAEREPIDTDPGGNNLCALPLSSSAPTWRSVSTRKIAPFIRDGWVSTALPGMRKWMRAHTGETCYTARQAGRRGVYPSGPSLVVLGACGYCGLAHVWINVFPLDRADMTVKPLLTAQRIRSDYESDAG